MVRKIIAAVLCIAVILAVPIAASAAEIPVYAGNISTTELTYFKDIANKVVGINDKYVFFRTDQYNYLLLVGNISYDGEKFVIGDKCHQYLLNTKTTPYSYSYVFDPPFDNFTITPNKNLVYSNLGHYPDLIERSNYYEIATLILLLAVVCIYLFRSIFSFCLRRRVY